MNKVSVNKKSFLGNSLLIFVGVNIANLASYLLYILLLKYDKVLYNDYIPISSIVAILFVVSLIIFRAFAVNGRLYPDLWDRWVNNKVRLVQIAVAVLIGTMGLSFVLTLVQDKYSFLAVLLTIYTGLASYAYSMYRGIRQYDGDLVNMIIGINIETFGRLVIGFALGYFLKWGIEGILLSMVIAHIVGIFYMFKRPVRRAEDRNLDARLATTFINSFIFTLGLELFANFLILYTNAKLQADYDMLTNFNALEFFRKTVMLSIVAISGFIISTSAKKSFSKKFVFVFTLGSGFIVAASVIGLFYFFKDAISGFINLDLGLIDQELINIFFIGTLLSAIAYLLCTWLFSFQKKIYIWLPPVISVIELAVLVMWGNDFTGIINSFAVISAVFFAGTFVLAIREVIDDDQPQLSADDLLDGQITN